MESKQISATSGGIIRRTEDQVGNAPQEGMASDMGSINGHPPEILMEALRMASGIASVAMMAEVSTFA